MSTLPKGHKTNLDTIIKAAKNGDLGVYQTYDSVTNEEVTILVARSVVDGETQITPLAQMFGGFNPYERFYPPAPEKVFPPKKVHLTRRTNYPKLGYIIAQLEEHSVPCEFHEVASFHAPILDIADDDWDVGNAILSAESPVKGYPSLDEVPDDDEFFLPWADRQPTLKWE